MHIILQNLQRLEIFKHHHQKWMGSIFGYVSACTCRMALPPTAGCFFKLSLCENFSKWWIKIFLFWLEKWGPIRWNEKKKVAYKDGPVNKE